MLGNASGGASATVTFVGSSVLPPHEFFCRLGSGRSLAGLGVHSRALWGWGQLRFDKHLGLLQNGVTGRVSLLETGKQAPQ